MGERGRERERTLLEKEDREENKREENIIDN